MPAFRGRLRRRPDYPVASPESMLRRAEEVSRRTGQSLDEGAALVVEDLERAAAALGARTAPLVPACGVLVAAAGLLLKSESDSSFDFSDVLLALSVLFAVTGLAFLVRSHFIYAGRRSIGLAPAVGDIAFARDALARKHTSAYRGGWLAGLALACLLLGILTGFQLGIVAG